jgi:hypothetical protein
VPVAVNGSSLLSLEQDLSELVHVNLCGLVSVTPLWWTCYYAYVCWPFVPVLLPAKCRHVSVAERACGADAPAVMGRACNLLSVCLFLRWFSWQPVPVLSESRRLPVVLGAGVRAGLLLFRNWADAQCDPFRLCERMLAVSRAVSDSVTVSSSFGRLLLTAHALTARMNGWAVSRTLSRFHSIESWLRGQFLPRRCCRDGHHCGPQYRPLAHSLRCNWACWRAHAGAARHSFEQAASS